MRLINASPAWLIAAAVALVPARTVAAVPVTMIAPVTVTAVAGGAAVLVSGTVSGASQLQAVLYATVSPNIPTAFLSRRPIVTDAAGHFAATLPVAPAYFAGALVTVIVQTTAGVILGRGSVTLADPGVSDAGPAPATLFLRRSIA